MGKLKDTITKLIPGSKQKYVRPTPEIRGIEGNALKPVEGLARGYVVRKAEEKSFKPRSMKNFDSSKWGGEPPMKKPTSQMQFKMNKKGVISKKK
jgi:hypothetical protein